MTVEEKEAATAEWSKQYAARKESEAREREREIEDQAERREIVAKLRKVETWMVSNHYDVFAAHERAEYLRAKTIRRNASVHAVLTGEENVFQAQKCAKVENKTLDTIVMRMAKGSENAAKALDVTDADADVYLDAAEWLLARAKNGVDEDDEAILMEALGS